MVMVGSNLNNIAIFWTISPFGAALPNFICKIQAITRLFWPIFASFVCGARIGEFVGSGQTGVSRCCRSHHILHRQPFEGDTLTPTRHPNLNPNPNPNPNPKGKRWQTYQRSVEKYNGRLGTCEERLCPCHCVTVTVTVTVIV